jgi:L-histidine N-alpha-methyltransferase
MVVRRPGDDRTLELGSGDEIRTEISCKFTRSSFDGRLAGTGLVLDHWWTDPGRLFALALLQPGELR